MRYNYNNKITERRAGKLYTNFCGPFILIPLSYILSIEFYCFKDAFVAQTSKRMCIIFDHF